MPPPNTSTVPMFETVKGLAALQDQFRQLAPVARQVGDTLAKSVTDTLAPLRAATDAVERFQAGLVNVAAQASQTFAQLRGVVREYLTPITAAVKEAFAPVGRIVGSILGPVASAVAGVAARVGKAFTGTVDLLAGAFGSLTGVFGALAGKLGDVVGAVVGVGEQMARFVQLADPGVFILFQRAVMDLMATIGQGLSPILELVTGSVRAVADVFAALAPVGKLVADALRPVFTAAQEVIRRFGASLARLMPAVEALARVWAEVQLAIMPVVELIADVFAAVLRGLGAVIQTVAPYVVAFTRVVGELVKALVDWVSDLLGLPKFDPVKTDGSVGAAVTQTRIGGVGDIGRQAYTSAFMMGPVEKADEQTARNTAQLLARVNEIAEILRNPGRSARQGTVAATGADNPTTVAGKAALVARSLDPLGVVGWILD